MLVLTKCEKIISSRVCRVGSRERLASLQMSIIHIIIMQFIFHFCCTIYVLQKFLIWIALYSCPLHISTLLQFQISSNMCLSKAQSFLQLRIYWGQWVENHQFSILPIHIGSPYPLYQINIQNRSIVILKFLNLYSAQISVIMNRHTNKNLVLVFCVLYLTNASAVGGLHESFCSLP